MRTTTAVLAFTIGLTGLAVAHPARAATVDTVASSDAHVVARRPSAHDGDARILTVDGRAGRTKHAYLRFVVPGLPAGQVVDTVTLRLRPRVSSGRGVDVYRTGTGWEEDRLTWASRPGERTHAGSSGALRSGTPEVIVLDARLVTPGKPLSLRLETSADAALRFVSSEGLVQARPVLRVSTTSAVDPPVGEQPPVVPPAAPPVVPPVAPPVVPPVVPPVPEQPPVVDQPPVVPPAPEPPPVVPPPGTSFPPAARVIPKVVGMSAPASLWDTRIGEVGADGIEARRIFADLSASGSSQLPLIRRAIADGMIPVISYKVPSPATLASGGYDAWLATLRAQLTALGAPVTVTYWHEPHGDMTPAEFRAGSQRFLQHVKAPTVAVGPILNGWLLDNLRSTTRANFDEYTSPALLQAWDFVGIDSYQEGSAADPSTSLMPARAVPQLAAWLDTQGFPDKKIVLGEYNGFTGAAIAQAGEWILGTPELWIACVWNVDNFRFSVLAADRAVAFRQTKADPRAMR